MGRPSKDLHVVIGVLLLQQLHDLSDAETVEALAFNMAWHYALDVRSEADSYFCEKTLRNYRRLFIEQGLDELLFRCLTDRMVQGFSVDTSHQRMDSTALRSAMRALTRLGIVVESISKFARELERYHPGLHEQISKEEIRRYVDREGNGAFANTAPSVSKRRLGEAGQDLLALVLQFRDTAAAKLSSFAILERVLRDQFEIVDDECGDRDAKRAAIRDPKDVPCDTVGNPADPDASYNAHKGQGYMAQIVETYCEDDSNEAVAATPDLITHVERPQDDGAWLRAPGYTPARGDPSFWLSMKASKQTWRTSMRKDQDSAVEALVEQLIEGGRWRRSSPAFSISADRAAWFLGAGHYERTPERRGYANGTRPKKIDTPAGTVRLEVPKTAGHEAPFYPQALEPDGAPAALSCWPWRRCISKASPPVTPRR